MYSLFALLFRKSYWLMLFRKATWYEAGLSFRRVHKDRRARKHILLLLLQLLIPFLCAAWLAAAIGTGAIFLIPVFFLIWWRSRVRAREDSVSLSIKAPPPPIYRELSTGDRRKLRAYLEE